MVNLHLFQWHAIYCADCGSVQPVVMDYLPADERNDHDALDLVCGRCNVIIATLHNCGGRR